MINEEFKVVQALVELLYPFNKATKILFGSNYATLSIIVPTIIELIYQLNNSNSNFDIVNKTLKQSTIEGLRNQFNILSGSTSQVENDMREEPQHDETVDQTEIDKYLTLSEIDPTEENDL
ncbi:45014_t:CDS:2, partial [Gigaspora margarita]